MNQIASIWIMGTWGFLSISCLLLAWRTAKYENKLTLNRNNAKIFVILGGWFTVSLFSLIGVISWVMEYL